MSWARRSPLLLAVVLIATAFAAPAVAASHAGACAFFACQKDGDGLNVSDESRTSAREPGRAAVSSRRATRETTLTPGCPGNDPNTADVFDMACTYMTTYCADAGLASGWLVWVWTRELDTQGNPSSPWQRAGLRCTGRDAIPARRAVTADLIQRAFARLPFTQPVVNIQPKGNLTLVNLPTYYQITWPQAGYAPGEVATVRLLGRRLLLKPVAANYLYRFGDGQSLGPTTNPGAPYPVGTIRHTYRDTGTVPVSARATYTGLYSLDGETWQPIDLTIPVTGPAVDLAVKQASARLVTNPPGPACC